MEPPVDVHGEAPQQSLMFLRLAKTSATMQVKACLQPCFKERKCDNL